MGMIFGGTILGAIALVVTIAGKDIVVVLGGLLLAASFFVILVGIKQYFLDEIIVLLTHIAKHTKPKESPTTEAK